MTDHHDRPAAITTSVVEHDGASFWLERHGQAKRLVVTDAPAAVLDRFRGRADGGRFTAELTPDNALALRQSLPWLRPTALGLTTSAGFGDRLGLSTPGHVAALQAVGGNIRPIFAQQSIREMGRTRRTPRNVLDDATWGAFEAGWSGPVSADADHLKTVEDIENCAAAGFVFFTLDPGDWVDPAAESADAAAIEAKARALDWAALDSSYEAFLAAYRGRRLDLGHEALVLEEEALVRAMAKYGPALVHAITLYRHLDALGLGYEFELAVDETDYPTKPVEHVVLVSELQRLGAAPVSVAPRFVGGFEKGVEYIGDLAELKRDFAVHAAIARALGPYKLSLHSGSDKYSTYPLIAEATAGAVHLKTAGTTWVEALRVVARHTPALFRDLLALSLRSFEQNRQSYHLSCDPSRIPADVPDAELDGLITAVDSRQVLHVGFGAALTTLKEPLNEVWREHEDELHDVIRDHFIRHLEPFTAWA
jgi:hypothetical protein